jgi:hypothetical protein
MRRSEVSVARDPFGTLQARSEDIHNEGKIERCQDL